MRIVVFLIVVLAGCASMGAKWTKPDSKPQDFDVDNAQCEKQSEERANAIATHIVYFYYQGCMQAKGWTPPPKPKEEPEVSKHESPKHDTPKDEAPTEDASKH